MPLHSRRTAIADLKASLHQLATRQLNVFDRQPSRLLIAASRSRLGRRLIGATSMLAKPCASYVPPVRAMHCIFYANSIADGGMLLQTR